MNSPADGTHRFHQQLIYSRIYYLMKYELPGHGSDANDHHILSATGIKYNNHLWEQKENTNKTRTKHEIYVIRVSFVPFFLVLGLALPFLG
jgi:hypothetical protein